jgi:zinc protease
VRSFNLAVALAASSLILASSLAAHAPALAQAHNATDNHSSSGHNGAQPVVAAPDQRNVYRDPDIVQPDPNVRRGVLPNGMRYAVMSNATPAKAISFRFSMNTGSYEEGDNERGVAHFLEHMAFNGGRNIPEGHLDTLFGAQGVLFGRDQNAETGFYGTTYMLDIPQVDDTKLDLAFKWLRDIADGLTLAPAKVDSERGVVLAEDDRSKGPARTLNEKAERFLAPELRSTTHDPIGTTQSIRAMDAQTLRSFYERWYRPDQAIVVVVGDEPVEALEKRVIDTFGSWKATGPATPHAAISQPDLTRGLDVLSTSEPSLATNVDVCRAMKYDEGGPDSVARLRLLLERRLWRDVVNERLRGAANVDDPPFGHAEVGMRESDREASYSCLDVLPLKDDWRRALDAGVTEVRRMQAHGATSDEVGRALEGVRAEYRAAADSARAEGSASLAERDLNALVRGDVIATPRERFRILDRAAAGLTEKDVDAAFRRDWMGAGPFVMLTTPQGVDAAQVKAAWRSANAGSPPAIQTAAKAAVWAYTDFGTPGKVVDRQEITNPGFVRVKFANGVILNFKRMTTSQDKIKVHVRMGAGRREIPNEDYYGAALGSQFFLEGGLGKHDAESMRRLFNDHGWGADFTILDDAFVLSGATNPTDLDVEMQILSAFVTDPGFHRSMDAKLPTHIDMMMRQVKTSPEIAMNAALNNAIAPNGVYVIPSREKLLKINAATFQRLFKPALTQAPLEVTIVGDVTEDHAVDAVSRTLGALPPRKAVDRVRPDTFFLRYPTAPVPTIRTTYESINTKAIVSLIWPLYVAEPKRRREEYALNILTNAMDAAIRHRVREQMGKSYAPQVGMNSPDAADQGVINAYIETTGADADAVAQAARETAADIAAHGITPEAFEVARKPVIDSFSTRMDDLDWWAGGMDGSAGNYEILREFIDWQSDMQSVTLDDVNRYAKTWLTQAPIVVIVTPSPPAAPAAAPIAPAKR